MSEKTKEFFSEIAEDLRPVADKVLSRAERVSVKVQDEIRRNAVLDRLTQRLASQLREEIVGEMDAYFEDCKANYRKFF